MIHQPRVYTIFEHNKSAFHERFRDHAARIMETYGFDIIATWESQTGSETDFVYLLSWPNKKTMIDSGNGSGMMLNGKESNSPQTRSTGIL